MIENSLQLLGPPGCGKTETLLRMVDDKLAAGVLPEQIVFVSFARKSIQEAKERAMRRFNLDPKRLHRFRTLHSTGFTALGLQHGDVMSTSDYAELGRMLGEQFVMNVSPEDGLLLPSDMKHGSQYLRIIDRSRYRMVSLEEEWHCHDTHDLSFFKCDQIARQLAEYKAKFLKCDYVDMIEQYTTMVDPMPCDLLIVDEAQDLTPLQWKMVKKMAEVAGEVVLAGDDDQAIHRWTGVDVREFISISDQKVVLEQSYRVPKKAHELAQRVVRRIKNRVPKTYYPTQEEGSVTWHYELDSVPFDNGGSFTVMARTNGFVQELAKKLYNMGYYYSVKGRGPISEKQAAAIATWRRLRNGEAVETPRLKDLYEVLPKQGDKAVLKRGASKLLDALPADGSANIHQLCEEFGLKLQIDLFDEIPDAYKVLGLGDEMVAYLRYVENSGEDITKPPRIKLSTMHAMKGGEDDNCVVYLGTTKMCEESSFPDDEHRIYYVAVTRTRNHLHLVQSSKKYRYML